MSGGRLGIGPSSKNKLPSHAKVRIDTKFIGLNS
jgi:hypothetical protein